MINDALSSEFDPLDAPAEEFLSRFRRGEHPALSEYESRFPELAGRIRVLFPALIEMEHVGNQQAEDDLAAAFGHRESVPTRIGEFRILRKVGEGGMGVVYEAMQESLGRHVALKVLPHEREKKYLERFRREARAAAKLHHTNIVPVFGVGEADGLHFYAMQFIPGLGLDLVLEEVRRLRSARNPSGLAAPPPEQTRTAVAGSVAEGLLTGVYAPSALPSDSSSPSAAGSTGSRTELASQPEARYYREIARIGVQVAEALAHAHEQGVLHRDIKPSNLLLDLHGTVWVTDFGLAKADDEHDLTRTGDIVGTLRYMSPERFRGKSDVHSEVYSLGVTLYELLTLQPVFPETDRVALIERVCHSTPIRPRKIDGRIPRDLETIVLKAMARDPADRYHSAAAIADDLRRFLADRSITARRASPAEQVRRWARRNKAVSALLAVLLCGSVSVAIVFAIQGEQLRGALKSSENDRRDLDISRNEALRQEREARLQRLDSMIAEARAKTLGRKPGQRFESLARLDEAVALARELNVFPQKAADLRNAFVAALAVPDFHIAQSWDGFPKGSVAFDFNGDHTVYARTNEDGTCRVARVADDSEICRVPVPPGPSAESQVHLSGDGHSLLLVRAGGEAHMWRVGSEPECVFVVPGAIYGDLRRDGRVAAVSHGDGSVSILDVLREIPRIVLRLPPTEAPGAVSPVLHPFQPRVVLLRLDPQLAVVRDTETGQVIERFTGFTPLGAAWHPAGASLAISTTQGEARFFDGSTFRCTATWRVGELPMIEFNPAGDRLVAAAWGGTLHLYEVFTGQRLHRGLPFRDGVRLRWDRTGTRLAGPVSGGRLNIWQVGDGREFRILQRIPSAITYHRAAMHPDGRLVAAGTEKTVGLWDLDTGRVLQNLSIRAGVGQPVFDPRGAMWTPSDVWSPLRWPIRENSSRTGEFTIGPPELIAIPPGTLARSSDARVWLGVRREREDAFIWRPDQPLERESLPTGADQGQVNLSPDGRWATTSLHTTAEADLWDMQTRKRVKRLYVHSGDAIPSFSPDRKWLWVNSDGGQLLHVRTWEPGPKTGRAEGRPAFTADSKIIALESGTGSVRLLETETGRELVRLDNPHQDPLFDLAFTPDGGRLVGASAGKNAVGIHVWELRLIRKQLADRGLDWAAPPLPASQASSVPLTLTAATEFLSPPAGGDDLRAGRWEAAAAALAKLPTDLTTRAAALLYRSVAYDKLQQHDKADADRAALRDAYLDLAAAYNRYSDRHSVSRERALSIAFSESALRVRPDDPTLANNLAWALVTGPVASQDPQQALPLALRAVAAGKHRAAYHNTLGCTYYRLGKYEDAIKSLNRSLQLSDPRSAVADRYLLALCHFKMGDTLLAYTEFTRAMAGHLRWRRQFNQLDFNDVNDLAEECVFTLLVSPPR